MGTVVALSILLVSSCAVLKGKEDDDRQVISLVVKEICNNRERGLFITSSATAAVALAFVPKNLDETARRSLMRETSIVLTYRSLTHARN
jgi:hypothetical protein